MVKIRAIGILVVLVLLALAGCGKDNATADVVAVDSLDCDCEECAECEDSEPCPELVCPACPVCVDAECVLSKQELELEFDNVELISKDTSGSEFKWNLYYTAGELDHLKKLLLYMNPRCDDGDEMLIEISGKKVFEGELVCNMMNEFEISTNYLVIGRNTLRFTSDQLYSVRDVEAVAMYNDREDEVKNILDFEFEEADKDDESTFMGLSDANIRNYHEYKFKLSEDETSQEFVFVFDAPEREGDVIILLNDEELFSGALSMRNNRIELPNELLIAGNNYLMLIGIPG